MSNRIARRRAHLVLFALVASAAPGLAQGHGAKLPAPPAPPTVLVPIGGGYDTVGDYVRVTRAHATGPSIDIVVLPTTYAETRAEAEDNGDYELAVEHVAELDAACEATLGGSAFPGGCNTTLVELWVRDDASDPAVVAQLAHPAVDGVFILGGDQGAAMAALVATPAEQALAGAYARGSVLGGTSAGNSVLSRTMTNGYTDYGDASVGFQIGALDVWDGLSDPLERGFSFGSTKALFDQHLYERGRFGRLLNEAARTADAFGRGGLLAIGVETDTSPVIENDTRITEVFGASSITVADLRTLRSRYAWVDTNGEPVDNPTPDDTPTAALSARDVLVHVLAPRSTSGSITYDLDRRVASLDGRPRPVDVRDVKRPRPDSLTAPRDILLGGDLSVGPSWPGDSKVLRELVARAGKKGPMLVIAAGYADAESAQGDLDGYSESLTESGWTRPVRTIVYPAAVSKADLRDAAGVILLAADQVVIPQLVADRTYVALVREAYAHSPIVLLDRSLAAIAGDVYDAVEDAADWVEAWKADQAQLRPGLGLVRMPHRPVAFEPRVQYDYKYGRLFGIPYASPSRRIPIVFGISEGSALLVTPRGAEIVGENPVLEVDLAEATTYLGDNGAFGVLNAVVDVYEPEQRQGRGRYPLSHRWFLGTDAGDWTPRRQR